jgi:hypothetical protein
VSANQNAWTHDPPTKPGWYFIHFAGADYIEPKRVLGGEKFPRNDNLWCGPVSLPALPVPKRVTCGHDLMTCDRCGWRDGWPEERHREYTRMEPK